ncbi:YciN family protein [Rouxiella sp. Mn2063]|uniref:YciN family protein n=1 Tax=Rouxiella sp. Mn2063 TaxID=3395262 RepID=UPI003BED143B
MHENKTAIARHALLIEANKAITEHQDYQPGMMATSVEEKGGVLVFHGPFFLDDNGLPTLKTTAVFNMFKYLAHCFSDKYTLQD